MGFRFIWFLTGLVVLLFKKSMKFEWKFAGVEVRGCWGFGWISKGVEVRGCWGLGWMSKGVMGTITSWGFEEIGEGKLSGSSIWWSGFRLTSEIERGSWDWSERSSGLDFLAKMGFKLVSEPVKVS